MLLVNRWEEKTSQYYAPIEPGKYGDLAKPMEGTNLWYVSNLSSLFVFILYLGAILFGALYGGKRYCYLGYVLCYKIYICLSLVIKWQ